MRNKIWFNVTTSNNWDRPPVGIVRAERNIGTELSHLIDPELFGFCEWKDGRFVECTLKDIAEKQPAKIAKRVETWELFQKVGKRAAIKLIAQGFYSLTPTKIQPIANRLLLKLKKAVVKLLSLKNQFKLYKQTKIKFQESVFSDAIRYAMKKPDVPDTPFKEGDIFISMGLDWDYEFYKKLFWIKEAQKVKIVCCCYDLIPVKFPHYCVAHVAQHFTSYFVDLAYASDLIICISKNTQQDLHELIRQIGGPEIKSAVFELGDNVADQKSSKLNITNSKEEYGNYILFVSTIERRKNHVTLYNAYHILAEQGLLQNIPKLIFVGMQGWGVSDLLNDLKLDPLLQGHIIVLNDVDDAQLEDLYKNAMFCLFPSLYEGWGLPIAEALARGKFVIASNGGSIPEVGGRLVDYLKPLDPYEWAQKILFYSSNPSELEKRTDLVLKSYKKRSWLNGASQILRQVEKIPN